MEKKMLGLLQTHGGRFTHKALQELRDFAKERFEVGGVDRDCDNIAQEVGALMEAMNDALVLAKYTAGKLEAQNADLHRTLEDSHALIAKLKAENEQLGVSIFTLLSENDTLKYSGHITIDKVCSILAIDPPQGKAIRRLEVLYDELAKDGKTAPPPSHELTDYERDSFDRIIKSMVADGVRRELLRIKDELKAEAER